MVSCEFIIFCTYLLHYFVLLGPPNIVSLSNNITIVEGEYASFMCKVNNDPESIENIKITWFNNNNHMLINHIDRVSISSTMESGPSRTIISTITIDPVLHQDAGQYSCVAMNHLLLSVSNSTHLSVKCMQVNQYTDYVY